MYVYVCICMYIYVCIYVCMYVCMYVCIHESDMHSGHKGAVPPALSAGGWSNTEHVGLMSMWFQQKRWYHCELCDYLNDRLYHSKMHYERIHVKKVHTHTHTHTCTHTHMLIYVCSILYYTTYLR
jgi:hypothetical protein